MENAALLIGAIGGLITAITGSIIAVVKARKNDEKLSEVQTQVTPSNGQPLAAMVEEMVEHLRSTGRRVDLHDEILTRLAHAIDRLEGKA